MTSQIGSNIEYSIPTYNILLFQLAYTEILLKNLTLVACFTMIN